MRSHAFAATAVLLILPFVMATLVAADLTFTLEARMTGYVGIGGSINAIRNPTLEVEKGDHVTITIVNAELMAHDVVLDRHQVRTKPIFQIGEKADVRFVAEQSDTYYCSIPGHRLVGMEGKIHIMGQPAAPAVTEDLVTPLVPEHVHAATIDEVGAVATAIPPPITRSEPTTVVYKIFTTEVEAKLEDGTTYELWTYNNQIPGPMLRARVGDTVEVELENSKTSKMVHSIDFHAATGPGGGAAVLQVPPGRSKTLRFKVLNPGLFVYHCATPHIPSHLARGMFGMILVEPPQGMPKVDREFYVMQGEYYTTNRVGVRCHQMQDDSRLIDERPTYVVMNGRIGSLSGKRAMMAKQGETVRIYFGVGGPNLVCSFHVIGEIFDRVYREADLLSPPRTKHPDHAGASRWRNGGGVQSGNARNVFVGRSLVVPARQRCRRIVEGRRHAGSSDPLAETLTLTVKEPIFGVRRRPPKTVL